MPRRTIFVRDDDLDAFEAILDRPGWLHWAVNNPPGKFTHRDLNGEPITAYKEMASRQEPESEDPTTYISEDEMP